MSQRVLRHLALLLVLAALALAAGCGGGDGDATTTAASPPPTDAPVSPPTTPTAPISAPETATAPTEVPVETATGPVEPTTAPSGSPDLEAYRAEATGVCVAARARSQALVAEIVQSGGDPSADLVRRLIDGTTEVRDMLRAVETPDEIADAHQRMLTTYDGVVERLNALFGERGADALDAAGTDAELNRLGLALGESWEELGLPECAMV